MSPTASETLKAVSHNQFAATAKEETSRHRLTMICLMVVTVWLLGLLTWAIATGDAVATALIGAISVAAIGMASASSLPEIIKRLKEAGVIGGQK